MKDGFIQVESCQGRDLGPDPWGCKSQAAGGAAPTFELCAWIEWLSEVSIMGREPINVHSTTGVLIVSFRT